MNRTLVWGAKNFLFYDTVDEMMQELVRKSNLIIFPRQFCFDRIGGDRGDTVPRASARGAELR